MLCERSPFAQRPETPATVLLLRGVVETAKNPKVPTELLFLEQDASHTSSFATACGKRGKLVPEADAASAQFLLAIVRTVFERCPDDARCAVFFPSVSFHATSPLTEPTRERDGSSCYRSARHAG